MKRFYRNLLYVYAFSLVPFLSPAQDLTTADYQRAEKMLGYNTLPLIDRNVTAPTWLAGDRFWYRVTTPGGAEYYVVDPAKGTRTTAFDAKRLIDALNVATGKTYDAGNLPFSNIVISPDYKTIFFTVENKRWRLNLADYVLAVDDAPMQGNRGGRRFGGSTSISPDGKKEVFLRDWNLWVRDLATRKETQLTTDGIENFGYATDNAGWRKSEKPIVVWSPDSKQVATYQQDQRHVSDMYLVTTNVGEPRLEAWKYPLPTDSQVILIHRVIIDVDNPKITKLQLAAGPRRGTLCDDISCAGKDFGDVTWSDDGKQLAFVTVSRDHKDQTFFIADAATGAVREVFQENVPTQYESGQGDFNWRYLSKTNEIIWYSERDNWGHLYLYDAATGKLKNQITKGDFTISRVMKVDEQKRVLYFLANGREPGNPYFDHLYKVNFDGKNFALLTPETGQHQVRFTPSENYFIDTYSQPDVPPVTVLRDLNGKLITTLEKTDTARLKATGWKPPMPITVKARDGQLDLYGLMFTPTNLDPNKKYPVINYIYPGPQGGSVGSWAFSAARGDHQALAELGFVVVLIEGTCNPNRSKSFHDLCYGNMADNTLPDQIGGIKQLAAKYPYMDLDRVGVWGHSGGGFATAAAMFRYPEFYKVGISESGNHDNRNYEDDWGERYIGLLKPGSSGKSNYEEQANQNYAQNLKGKLMLAHGLMDDNVPPYNTLLVVEALEKANKDYDLVIFPNARHGYGEFSYYMMRRRWDYFVKNLLGVNPPKEYKLGPSQSR
ncbi:MAG: DPP IV N-terminal domain-containing protein [Flavisolibacter sp.]